MTRHATPWLVLTIILLAAFLACGCMGTTIQPAGNLKKFNSADEIKEYIKENSQKALDAYYPAVTGRVADGVVTAPAMATAEGAKMSADFFTGALDYSQTNVQVAGVDEPDIVKNDGRYIYTISGSTLVIVDAYPAEKAKIISETDLESIPKELFVSGNRLILFSTGTTDTDIPLASREKVAVYPVRRMNPVTHATVYDLSDHASPGVIKEYTIDGDYIDARMIKDSVYMITREYIYPYNDEIVVPFIREGTKVIVTPDVYYFDNPEREYVFTTVTSFDATSGAEKDAKTFLLGSGNIVYVSQNAMYISYQKYHPVIRPMYEDRLIAQVPASGRSSTSTMRAPVPVLWEDFNQMSEAEKQAIMYEMKGGEQESIRQSEMDQTSTVIHKIGIRDGSITYKARGEVNGYLKNQFAMDEYDGNLRVATTSDVWTRRGQYEYNNVFVLNTDMETVGELTHVAEQEKIYSTRFVGERLYMVTFKRIDPFFVIDLSSPEHPKILGKLKIPGYSDYLHPYDKTHIIGIGKETAANDWGGVSTQGIKLALFDVSDVTHPKQIDKVEIGDAGSDSAALSDHKAFLFDKTRNLLVIPVRAVTLAPVIKENIARDRQHVWYGVYVFGVTPQTGFVLRGTVEHGSAQGGYYWYGSSRNEVKRSLYIDNVLYTLSSNKILANDLDRVNNTIKKIDLPGSSDTLYPPMLGI